MGCLLDALGTRLAEAGLLVIDGPYYGNVEKRRKLLAWLKDQAISTAMNCDVKDGEFIAPLVLGRLPQDRKVAWIIHNTG